MATRTGLEGLDDEDVQLILALQRGPLEYPHWRTFVDLLRLRVGAATASLSFRLDDSHGPGVRTVAMGEDVPFAAEVEMGGIQFVTPPPGHARIPYGHFINIAQFLDPTLPDHVAFKRDVMEHHQFDYLRVARVFDGLHGLAWLAVGRAGDDFSPEDIAVLDALVPHIENSLRIFRALDQERSRSRVSGEAVRRLNLSWLKLDAHGLILDFDANAEALLQNSAAFLRPNDGRLVLADPRADREMRAAISALNRQPNGRARAFHLDDQPWLDMLLVSASDDSLMDAMEPRIIAYIHGETNNEGDRRGQLCDMFGLAPKESLLAIALSRGQTIKEAAAELGLTEKSAREYTKRIYGKTGTRGQADLVRLILTSVAALA